MKSSKDKPILVKEIRSLIKALKKLNFTQKTSILHNIDKIKSHNDDVTR